MKELWSIRTDVKRDARDFAKTLYGFTDDARPEAQKERAEALIGTPTHRIATYLCGGTVRPAFSCVYSVRFILFTHDNCQLESPEGQFQHEAVKKLLFKSIFQGSIKSKSLAYHLNTRHLRQLFDPLPAQAAALIGTAVRVTCCMHLEHF